MTDFYDDDYDIDDDYDDDEEEEEEDAADDTDDSGTGKVLSECCLKKYLSFCKHAIFQSANTKFWQQIQKANTFLSTRISCW